MSLSQIRNFIDQLKTTYGHQVQSTSLRKKCIAAYYQKVLGQLDAILGTNKDEQVILTKFKQFLTENWLLVNGTLLSYTALPDSEITHLICDVAQYVVDETNKTQLETVEPLGIVKTLMPTVNTDSLDPNKYPHLGSWHDGKQWHTVTVDIKTILKTHILGREGLYLLSSQLLNELDVALAPKLSNPYYDVLNDHHKKEHVYVDENEYKRLAELNPLTSNVVDARNQYDLLANDQSNLLGQLRELLSQLYYNSKNAIGKEEYAGSGAYTAIPKFMEYYDKLNAKSKEKIPDGVKKEIATLIGHTANKEKIADIGSCLATRSTELNKSIFGHEVILSSISLTQDSKQELIKDAKQRLYTAKDTLKKEIIHRSSCDQLGLNEKLITTLGVELKIATLDDLTITQELSAQEIDSLLNNAEIKRQIVKVLSTMENLVVFSIETAPHRLTTIFNKIGMELSGQIKTTKDLAAWLVTLDIERTEIVLRAMQDRLSTIIKDVYNFQYAIAYLGVEQQTLLCNALKNLFPDMIKNFSDFSKVMQFSNHEQQLVLYHAYKDQLHDSISNLEFSDMMGFLDPGLRALMYETYKDKLVNNIAHVNDLCYVLKHLDAAQSTDFLTACKPKLSKIMKSGFDFTRIKNSLTPEQYISFLLEICKNGSADDISANNLNQAIEFIVPEQRALFYTALINQASTNVLSLLLIQLAHESQWDLVRQLCTTVDANQPAQQAVIMALNAATDAQHWDTIKVICSMNGINKPDSCSVWFALYHAVINNQIDLVENLCAMKGANKPCIKTVIEALEMVPKKNKEHILNIIASIKLNEYIIPTQTQKVKDLIATLKNEINDFWRPNKDLKRQKVAALEKLLVQAKVMTLEEAAKEIEIQHPIIMQGVNSRVANLIMEIGHGEISVAKERSRHTMLYKQSYSKITDTSSKTEQADIKDGFTKK